MDEQAEKPIVVIEKEEPEWICMLTSKISCDKRSSYGRECSLNKYGGTPYATCQYRLIATNNTEVL